MANTTRQPAGNLFQANLDGEIVTLPWRSVKSVLGFFEHLESMARCQEREFGAPPKKASPGRPRSKTSKTSAIAPQQAETTRFRELGRQVIRTAKCQVRVLQGRAQKAQSLVLINDWAIADRLWSELLMECKTPLFELNFLEELWGISPDRLDIAGWSLGRHWHQFVLIQAEVEIIMARRHNLVELSDTIERQLGNWLKRFGEILEKLDEESAG